MKKNLTFNKFVAFVIWIIGTWNTITLLEELGVSSQYYTSLYTGILTQIVLSYSQSRVWFNQKSEGTIQYVVFGVFIIIDIAANVGGLMVYVNNITHTSAYSALLGDIAVNPDILKIIALVLGTLIAIAPEVLYRSN